MHPRLKRHLWLSWITVLTAAAILAACLLIPRQIPPRWIKPRFTAEFATESYLVPASQHVNYLQFDMMCEAIGADFESSTLVTAKFTDRAYFSDDNGGSIHGGRDAAIDRIPVQFPKLCDDAGCPTLAGRFDELISAQTTGITIDYPERRLTAVLMAGQRYLVYAATAALIVAAPLTLYFLYALLKARRAARTNCCTRCGYSLAGLTPSALCPECGLDITTHLANVRSRRGRSRRAVGLALMVIGLALGGTFLASAKSSIRPTCLFSQLSSDGATLRKLWLNRGGLHIEVATATVSTALRALAYPIPRGGPQNLEDFSNGGFVSGYETPPPPIDWSLWYDNNDTGYISFQALWISLWPLASLATLGGTVLLILGRRARKLARRHVPTNPPQQRED